MVTTAKYVFNDVSIDASTNARLIDDTIIN